MALSYIYKCESQVTCEPYVINFKPGIYKIELWGAQGGNITGKSEGGRGGYASGILRILRTQKMYIFLGGHGFQGTGKGFTQNAFNGGGKGNFNSVSLTASSGGCATDLRTNLLLSSRILVAGGGGGATNFKNSVYNKGGCGGGSEGGDGIDGYESGTSYEKGGGGKRDLGGSSEIEEGRIGYGGNQTTSDFYGSGGGGGWFGGGAGRSHGASGGGGSGYASSQFIKSQLLSGCVNIPNFYQIGTTIKGHYGSGCARISLFPYCSCKNQHAINISYSTLYILFIINHK